MMDHPISLEDRRLLNPAFSGTMIVRASQGYWNESRHGLPFIYAYLVLPLVLHPETRERLPNSVVTKLPAWAERNAGLVTALPRRIGELAPATRDGVFAMATAGLAKLGRAGEIEPALNEKALSNFEKRSGSSEVTECIKKANFVGRWFAISGTVSTVLTILGVHL